MATKQRDPAREQFWRGTFSDWQASNQTVRNFCRHRRLTETAFHYWRRELRQRDAKSAPRMATPTFVPVTVIPSATLAVEVRCPAGYVVSLSNADAATLRSLFAALAPVPPC